MSVRVTSHIAHIDNCIAGKASLSYFAPVRSVCQSSFQSHSERNNHKHGQEIMKAAAALIIYVMMMNVAGVCFGQDRDYESSEYQPIRFTAFGGAGLINQSYATHGSIQFGGDIGLIKVYDFNQFPSGAIFEFGYAGPANHFGSGSALISTNYVGELLASRHKRLTLLLTTGYSRLFGTGNAANFGGGVELFSKDLNHALRFEIRDYFRIAKKEHNIAIRLGYAICASR
jgi:hypothetical protein